MKRKLQARLAALAQRTQGKLRWAMLVPLAALSASPSWAALPTVTMPTDGIGGTTCSDGDLICAVGAWFKSGINMAAVVVAAFFLIGIAIGCYSKWNAYSDGRASQGDLKHYLLYAGIFAAFVIAICTLAVTYAT